MNPRIKELAEQARLVYVMTKDKPYIEEDLQAFADLIVNELLSVMDAVSTKATANFTYMGADVPTTVHQSAIRAHFTTSAHAPAFERLNAAAQIEIDRVTQQVECSESGSLVYFAAPYSRMLSKDEFMKQFMRLSGEYMIANPGVHVISPLFNHFSLDSCPLLGSDWTFWENYSKNLLGRLNPARGDKVLVLDCVQSTESEGVQAELRIARALGIPVSYLTIPPTSA